MLPIVPGAHKVYITENTRWLFQKQQRNAQMFTFRLKIRLYTYLYYTQTGRCRTCRSIGNYWII